MAIETICSGCGQKLAVDAAHAGKRARCPACGQIYTVPLAVTPAAQPTVGEQASTPDSSIPADHPGLAETIANPNAQVGETDELLQQFWMQTGDGSEYGPVDRANLHRWFNEGRVGPGYQIRQGDIGPWQSADLFRPQPTNPYADAQPVQATQQPYASVQAIGAAPTYAKADASSMVLTMGILAWVFLLLGCVPISWIPGLVAWIRGRNSIREIQNGRMDPTNLALIQTGYYLGMVNVILTCLLTMAFALLIAISSIS